MHCVPVCFRRESLPSIHHLRHCWLPRGMCTSITSNKATGCLVLCIGRLPALPQRHARCSSPRVGPPCAPHDALCVLADRTAYACLARGAPSFGDLHWPRATAIPRPVADSPDMASCTLYSPVSTSALRVVMPSAPAAMLRALQPGPHLCTQSCYAICARCHAATLRATRGRCQSSTPDAGEYVAQMRRHRTHPPHAAAYVSRHRPG